MFANKWRRLIRSDVARFPAKMKIVDTFISNHRFFVIFSFFYYWLIDCRLKCIAWGGKHWVIIFWFWAGKNCSSKLARKRWKWPFCFDPVKLFGWNIRLEKKSHSASIYKKKEKEFKRPFFCWQKTLFQAAEICELFPSTNTRKHGGEMNAKATGRYKMRSVFLFFPNKQIPVKAVRPGEPKYVGGGGGKRKFEKIWRQGDSRTEYFQTGNVASSSEGEGLWNGRLWLWWNWCGGCWADDDVLGDSLQGPSKAVPIRPLLLKLAVALGETATILLESLIRICTHIYIYQQQ